MKFLHPTLLAGRDALVRRLLLPLVSGGICLSSCSDDIDRPANSSECVSFAPEVSATWDATTRSAADMPQDTVVALDGANTPLYLHTIYVDSIASPTASGDSLSLTRAAAATEVYDPFGVSAFAYTDAWDDNKTPNYFHDIAASKDGALASTYYWPGAAYTMRFFAYSPKGNEAYKLSDITKKGSPTIAVKTPAEVSKQLDLLVANTADVAGNTNAAVPLKFKHALTAVKFVCGDDMQAGKVESISLMGVCSTGTYNMNATSWSAQATPATFTQTFTPQINTDGTPNTPITTDAQTFMMIPQTLPAAAKLQVVFIDAANNRYTLTAPIAGAEWPMGKTVIYKLSTTSINWQYFITATAPADFTYKGGTNTYTVASYRRNSQNVVEKVAWKAQFSEDGVTWSDDKPDWLTEFTASGDGVDNLNTKETFNATVKAQVNSSMPSESVIRLQNATPKGSLGNPYNLANQTNGGDAIENTANCYVVGAPGWYSFPLVYGNAIKEGVTNESAYKSTATGRYVLKTFVNHAEADITDPYLVNNGCSPAKAELVWQDEKDLVTDIEYNSAGNGSIRFQVKKETIHQGNAVIAIKDGADQVLWSWHVWVTDVDVNDAVPITGSDMITYNFMPLYLGWSDSTSVKYDERSCQVKFIAQDNKKPSDQIITIKQIEYSVIRTGNNPHYQWGRKDPFQPIVNGAGTKSYFGNKTWYDEAGMEKDNDGNYYLPTNNWGNGTKCIKGCILNPNVIDKLYVDNAYYNIWSINEPTNAEEGVPVVKTIYDPSPVNYKVPPYTALLGFVNADKEKLLYNGIRNTLKVKSKVSPDKVLFFPASGCRFNSGEGRNIEYAGYVRSANASAVAYCYNLMNLGNFNYFKAVAMTILPVKDE